MKILHLSTSDTGGAGIAAVRLHQGLLSIGVDSKILTLAKNRNDIDEHYKFSYLDAEGNKFFRKIKSKIKNKLRNYRILDHPYHSRMKKNLKNRPTGHEMFSFPFSDFDLTTHPLVKQADIINLHWISDGYLDYRTFFFKINKPVVWTLHDMNPFTGGCHYAEDCLGYTGSCKLCPQLKNTIDENYAAKMLQYKKKIFSNISKQKLVIVTPSQWLHDCAEESILFDPFKKYTVGYGFDENIFTADEKIACRKKLQLPLDKKIILFVSQSINNERKGMKYLVEALKKIKMENVLLCSMGTKEKIADDEHEMINLGYINDEVSAAIAYNAADVFVSPSLADNFPNTVCESLMCGTPVVAFAVGGIKEQITSETGILAAVKDVDELKKGIEYILDNPGNYNKNILNKIATAKWKLNLQAEKYSKIYESLLF